MKRCMGGCRVVAFAIVMFALVASLSASAEDKGGSDGPAGWYLGASVGGVFPGGLSNQPLTATNGGVTANISQGFNLNTGWSVAGQAGYRWDGPRVEGEFLYQNFGRSATTIAVTGAGLQPFYQTVGSSSISSYSAFVNGYYDFKTRSQFSPYVGAGLGVTWLDSGGQTSSGFTVQTPGLSKSVLAYQAKAGVMYKLSSMTSLFLQYRYMGTGSFSYGGGRVTLGNQVFTVAPKSGSLSNSSLELGVQIRP